MTSSLTGETMDFLISKDYWSSLIQLKSLWSILTVVLIQTSMGTGQDFEDLRTFLQSEFVLWKAKV